MKIKLLVFDFDGTLADTKDIIYETINREMKLRGCLLSSSFKNNMGKTLLINQLSNECLKQDIESAVPIIIRKLTAMEYKVKLSKNIDLLSKIKKKKIILSNNSLVYIKAVLRYNKINFFSETYSGESFKDKTDALKKIMRVHGVKPSETIYVGDRETDIKYARGAKCISVAITNKIAWASRSNLLKQKPDFIISDLKQIEKIVRQLDSL